MTSVAWSSASPITSGSERRDIGAGAVVATCRIDDDDGAAGPRTPSSAATCTGVLRNMMPTRWSPVSMPIRRDSVASCPQVHH